MQDERFEWDDTSAYVSSLRDWRTSMSNGPTSDNKHDQSRMTAEDWKRLDSMSDDEINAAALSDLDAQPLTEAQRAQMRRPAVVKQLRHKLGMDRETFSAAYGIPLDTLKTWERHEAVPTSAEMAYLRVIEREPDKAKQMAPKVAAE